MAFGKYYSNSITTNFAVGATSEDLMTTFRSEVGDSNALIKKMSLLSSSLFTVSINGGVRSDVFLDSDGIFKLSFEYNDILIDSLVVYEDGITIYLAGIY